MAARHTCRACSSPFHSSTHRQRKALLKALDVHKMRFDPFLFWRIKLLMIDGAEIDLGRQSHIQLHEKDGHLHIRSLHSVFERVLHYVTCHQVGI